MKRLVVTIIVLCGLSGLALGGEEAPAPPADVEQAPVAEPQPAPKAAPPASVERFHGAKFGIFIHWGISSIPAKGEWVMANDNIPLLEYEKLLQRFSPEKFNAAQWVDLFKAAGAKYVTLTAKHHDGFCLFDSKLTDYDVMNTPLKRDIVKELTEACRDAGLQIFYYYSLSDWHHPDYWPWGWTGTRIPGRARNGDNSEYIAYYQSQICELCTNYGPIGGIWFDGEWDRAPQRFDLPRTYEIVHKLQPRALVGNNHHHAPAPGEDFQIFERTRAFNRVRNPFIPLETCETISGSWGYNAGDKRYKSALQLLRTLITAAGQGGNLLLNIGPLPDGSIPPEHADVLREMGQWLAAHGGTIYDTRRGPWVWREWGVSTYKGERAWLHFLKRPADMVVLPAPPRKLLSAATFDGREVKFRIAETNGGGDEIAISLPQWDDRSVTDFIIEMAFDGPLDGLWLPQPIRPNAEGILVLDPDRAELHGESHQRHPGWLWKDENDEIVWHVKAPRPAQYHAIITYSCPQATAGCEFSLGTGESRLIGKAEPTGTTWDKRDTIELPGIINLPADDSAISIKASGKPKWAFLQLFRIELRPAKAENTE